MSTQEESTAKPEEQQAPKEEPQAAAADAPAATTESNTADEQPAAAAADSETKPAAEAEQEKKDEAAAPEEAPKTEEPKKDEEAGAGDEAKKEELEKRIAELEKEVEELKGTAQDKKKEAEEATADTETIRADLKEAQEKQASTVSAFHEAEREKFELQPAYEQCLANPEQKDRAANYKAEIQRLESEFKAREEELNSVEGDMKTASAKYADSVNAKQEFVQALGTETTALHGITKEKIAKTVTGQHGETEEDRKKLKTVLEWNPFDLLDGMESIVREREREVSHAERQLRELSAICAMKTEEEEKLQGETTDHIAAKKKENDDYIKQLIYGFQDIRANLQADVEEIRKVNKEQAYNLRRGHVEKGGGRGLGGGSRTPRTTTGLYGGAAPRASSFRKEAPKSKECIALKATNETMQSELNALKKQLQDVTVDRTDSLKTLKSLETRLSRDKMRFSEDLRKTESDVAAKHIECERLERENKRMAEAVDHLTTIVENTRKQVRHVRSHHDPLPIEE